MGWIQLFHNQDSPETLKSVWETCIICFSIGDLCRTKLRHQTDCDEVRLASVALVASNEYVVRNAAAETSPSVSQLKRCVNRRGLGELGLGGLVAMVTTSSSDGRQAILNGLSVVAGSLAFDSYHSM